MKTSLSSLLVLALPLVPAAHLPGQAPSDIVATAVAAGSFRTLAAALEAAGLVEALRGAGPFTVFAPTDAAFAKLPEGTVATLLEPENRDKLTGILKYHVVAGRVSAVDALRVAKAKALQDGELAFTLDGGQLRVNGVKIVKNDIAATNGIIHVIDEVLLPPSRGVTEPQRSPVEFVKFVVERGVPLFNAGEHATCAAIYEVAARALLDVDDRLVSPATAKALEDALARAREQDNAFNRAWTLRRAIDTAWRELDARAGAKPVGSKAGTVRELSNERAQKVVFDFERAAPETRWISVNDDVMGGVSRAGFTFGDGGTGVFQGALSLERNGGFATVRSPARDLGLAGYDGLLLRVRGDGRRYGLSAMKTDRRSELRVWQTKLDTRPGEWMEVKVPFSALKLNVMGREVRGADGISPAEIRSLSFSIADKDETPFRLEIDTIRAYRDGSTASE